MKLLHIYSFLFVADAFRQEFTEINCTAGTISKYSHCVDNIDKVFFMCYDIQRINGSYSCEDSGTVNFLIITDGDL